MHWKDWCWSWNSNTLATRCEELTHWKRTWCWERLKAGGERDNRGWDGWMAFPTLWKWAWASSRSWWWTRKPAMLRSMGLQRVRHNWVTELNWIHFLIIPFSVLSFKSFYDAHIRNQIFPSLLKACSFSLYGNEYPHTPFQRIYMI